MAYIDAAQYTNSADMIAAAKAIRDRLWKPHKVILDKPRVKFVDVEFTEQKETSRDYGGLNPEFVKQAEAKARAQNAINEAEWRRRKAAENKAYKEKLKQAAIVERQRMQANDERAKIANSAAAIAAYNSWEWERRPTLKKQIMVLCDIYGISYHAIIGASRTKVIVELRHQFVAKIAKENPSKSMVEIGKAFGDRDHTSIRSALMKMGCAERGYPEKGAA